MAGLIYWMPTAMKVSRTMILMTTMALLMLADSDTPSTSRPQTAAMPTAATRLNVPVIGKPASGPLAMYWIRGVAHRGPSPPAKLIVGNRLALRPKSLRIDTT